MIKYSAFYLLWLTSPPNWPYIHQIFVELVKKINNIFQVCIKKKRWQIIRHLKYHGPKKTFGIKENCKKNIQRKYRVRKAEKKQKENHARRSFRASGCSFREMNRKCIRFMKTNTDKILFENSFDKKETKKRSYSARK